MVLDILGATMQVAQSLGQVICDELNQKILCISMDVGRILDSAFQDVLVDLDGRASVPEWGEAAQHFEDQNAERPPATLSTLQRERQ